jgi:hypothetical protein
MSDTVTFSTQRMNISNAPINTMDSEVDDDSVLSYDDAPLMDDSEFYETKEELLSAKSILQSSNKSLSDIVSSSSEQSSNKLLMSRKKRHVIAAIVHGSQTVKLEKFHNTLSGTGTFDHFI